MILTEAAKKKRSAGGGRSVLRVSRTLADLETADTMRRGYVAEVLAWRRVMPGRGAYPATPNKAN